MVCRAYVEKDWRRQMVDIHLMGTDGPMEYDFRLTEEGELRREPFVRVLEIAAAANRPTLRLPVELAKLLAEEMMEVLLSQKVRENEQVAKDQKAQIALLEHVVKSKDEEIELLMKMNAVMRDAMGSMSEMGKELGDGLRQAQTDRAEERVEFENTLEAIRGGSIELLKDEETKTTD